MYMISIIWPKMDQRRALLHPGHRWAVGVLVCLATTISKTCIFIYLALILPSWNCVWIISGYNECIIMNLNKTTCGL